MNNQSITRRILAVILTAVGTGVLGYLAVTGIKEALTALISLTSIVVGFYFGAKAAQV